MLFTTADLRVKAENFDLTKRTNIFRIICGAFLFPHVAGKFVAGGISDPLTSMYATANPHFNTLVGCMLTRINALSA
jgi:putative oxidoreductase